MPTLRHLRAWSCAILGAVIGLALVLGVMAMLQWTITFQQRVENPHRPADSGAVPIALYLTMLLAPVAAAVGGAYGWRLGAGLPLRARSVDEVDAASHPETTLVIGYGNTLRRDDGAGFRVAEIVETWQLPGVQARATHQLVPELAEALADVDRAIFVDARPVAEGDEAAAEVIPVTPSEDLTGHSPIGHTGDPSHLLALAQQLYGRCPEIAWVVTIPAADFEFGEQFSATAERGMAQALEALSHLLGRETGHPKPSDEEPATGPV